MALNTTVAAGTLAGPWVYNDYLSLLTGTMTDQPVFLKFTPGVNTNPALKLQTDGVADLLRAYKSDGTTVAATLDANGNLSVTSITTSGGGLLTVTGLQTTQSGAANGLQFKTWNGTAGVVVFSVGGQFGSAKAYIDNNGTVTAGAFAGKIHGNFGNSSWDGHSRLTGTGSGTFSHSLGTTPNIESIICTATNSSQTQGIDTLTSSSVHITSGGGFSFMCYLAIAD